MFITFLWEYLVDYFRQGKRHKTCHYILGVHTVPYLKLQGSNIFNYVIKTLTFALYISNNSRLILNDKIRQNIVRICISISVNNILNFIISVKS